MNAMRRWTFGRGVVATITLALLACSAWFARDARRHEAEFATWETARPIDIPVDLSRTGRFTAVFRQTCSRAHDEVIALKLPEAILSQTAPTQLLAGLSARFELVDANGTNVMEPQPASVWWGSETIDGAVPLFSIPNVARGDYEARLIVLRAVPALQGLPQRLEGRYLLCGIEAMPGVVATFFSRGCLGLGLLVGAILGYRLWRHPIPGDIDGPTSTAPTAEPNQPPQGAL